MDERKTAYKRRLSILKTRKSKNEDEDEPTSEIIAQRRVSFASKFAVKPFMHDAEANTIWDATYEEVAANSDQSICHITDSATHMSIDVSTNCEAPQHLKCNVGSNSVLNNTCMNMDENIQSENEVPQNFKQHKPKFGIHIKDSSKCAIVNPDRDLKLSLLNENMKRNIDLVSLTNKEINKSNSFMDLTIENRKDNNEESEMEFTKIIPTVSLNEGLNGRKTTAIGSLDNDEMDMTNGLLNKTEDIANYVNVGVCAKIAANFIGKNLNEKIDDNDMEFTCVLSISNNKENLAPIPANLLTPRVKKNSDDGDMELTKSFSPKIFENLKFKKVDPENPDNTNAMDITGNPESIEENNYCRIHGDEMDLEKYDNTINRTNECQLFIPNASIAQEDKNKCSLTEYKIESDIQAALFNIIEDPDNIPIIYSKRESSFCQLDNSIYSNPTSEGIYNTQYLINCKSRISEATLLQPSTATPNNDNFQIYKENILESTNTCQPAKEFKCTVLNVEDIPKVIQVHNCVLQTPQISNVEISSTIDNKNIRTEEGKVLNNAKQFKRMKTSNIESVDLHQFSSVFKNNWQLHPPKVTLNNSNISEINVFKPSSKNNTRCSFFEPMELGTTYDETSDKMNHSCKSIKENDIQLDLKYHNVNKIVFDIESATALQSEVVMVETDAEINSLKLNNKSLIGQEIGAVKKVDEIQKQFASETEAGPFSEADICTNIVDILSKSFERLEENCLNLKHHETDKLIFTTQSATSFEIEPPPTEAYGKLRQSMYGITRSHVVSTHLSTQELSYSFTHSAEVAQLKTICQEAKPIADDSLDRIHLDEEDGEMLQNLSQSRIILYDSNDESEDNDIKIHSLSNVGIQSCTLNKIVPLSELPSIPSNCSLDQLYDLLGWSAEKRPKTRDLPSIFNEELPVERQLKRSAEKKGFERLVQSCCQMLDTVKKMNEEEAAQAEADLARKQGRTTSLQSLEEWITQHKKIPSTEWLMHSLIDGKCSVSSRNVQFHLEFEFKTYIITNLYVNIIPESNQTSKLRQYISKLIMDKTQKSHIHSAIGAKFNLRTFLEYLQMKLENVAKIEREFLKLFGKVLVEARLSFDDNFVLQYLLIGRSRWLLKINCLDPNNLSQNSITDMSTLDGTIKVPKREIKNIAKKCPRGLQFLASFVDGVYELRNNRERKYCRELDVLLAKIEMKKGFFFSL